MSYISVTIQSKISNEQNISEEQPDREAIAGEEAGRQQIVTQEADMETNVEEERAHGPIIAGREVDGSYSSDSESGTSPIQQSTHM
jgi:hypothetical protein